MRRFADPDGSDQDAEDRLREDGQSGNVHRAFPDDDEPEAVPDDCADNRQGKQKGPGCKRQLTRDKQRFGAIDDQIKRGANQQAQTQSLHDTGSGDDWFANDGVGGFADEG